MASGLLSRCNFHLFLELSVAEICSMGNFIVLLCLRLEHTEEERMGEAEVHNFLSNASVPHQAQTEERRMEIVKVKSYFISTACNI